MRPISCQAILFDLDGTLIDSWRCVEYAWQTWCREHSIEYDDLLHKFNGTRAIDIIRTLKPELDYEKEANKVDLLELSNPHYLTAIIGAIDLLSLMPPNRWGIVTSGTHHVSSHKLKHAQITVPDTFITAEKVTQSKPHPQGYLLAASLLGIEPKDCLVFEDAPKGIEAARAAGMKVIALKSTFPNDALSQAETCIDNYKSLRVSIDDSQITIERITS